jgi:hypothetical protein
LELEIQSRIESISKISGWFSNADAVVFDSLLNLQRENLITGNLLEIGVFAGKSAVFLNYYRDQSEFLHVCDIFEGETNGENYDEISDSYENLSESRFKSNFTKVFSELPIIHACNSLELESRLYNDRFRFIHIDGSHLYNFVRNDLDFATRHLDGNSGIIVLDDFRSAHTLGVTAAMWEFVLSNELKPFLFTANKAYLCSALASIDLVELMSKLESKSLTLEYVSFLNYEVIRVISNATQDFEQDRSVLHQFLPPILFNSLAKFAPLRKAWGRIRRFQ